MPTIANMAKLNDIVISGAPAVSDAHVLIATATASSSATLEFTLGLDSLYDVYEFHFVNMHPATDIVHFSFQVNAVGASGFNETITSSYFISYNRENDAGTNLAYETYYDQSQGTAYQIVAVGIGNDDDESTSGVLTLFAPSSTTFVKHFSCRKVHTQGSGYEQDDFISGYINTTAAIDEISFKMSSGNIDAGQIKMYGIAKA
mgnify:CR=1 FL=1